MLSIRYIESIYYFAISAGFKKLSDKCDPHPLLEICEKIIEYDISPWHTRIAIMDKGCALCDLGRTEQAYAELGSIKIEEPPEVPYITKVVYYNNLMDYATRLGLYDEAEQYYEKALQLYKDMPESKLKERQIKLFKAAEYLAAYRKGDYEKTLEIISSVEFDGINQRVDVAMYSAKCHIALRETDKAREALDFVIKNANKTYFGKEAEELLKSL